MAQQQQYKMENGYELALEHYKKQKEKFLDTLELVSLEEASRAKEQLFAEVGVSGEGEQAVDTIIGRINNIIARNPTMRSLRAELAQLYRDQTISKEEIMERVQQSFGQIYDAKWIRQHVLSRLGTLGNTKINKINDNALLGKIRMLLNMSFRHDKLAPGQWTKKQLEGILYEHAVADGLQRYFANKPEFADIVQVSGIGASGGKGDVQIQIDVSRFSGSVTGKTDIREFQMQVKNMDLEHFLNATSHSEKLNVGSNIDLFREARAEGYATPQLAMYFLSKGDNVQRAIGKEVTMYGYADGKFLFTADLIDTLHFKRKCSLTFPYIAGKTPSAYIAWMKQKTI